MSHPGPSPLINEHAYFEALLPASQASHIAVVNGSWSTPSTWQDGLLPTDGARVLIPAGISVLYDIGDSPDLAWIRDEGSLSFADENANLLVETIAVMEQGALDIGTATDPFESQLTVTFADNGRLDTVHDPLQMARGLISHGHIGIYGEQVTPFVQVHTAPLRGESQIRVTGNPGWDIGNTLLVTGTVQGSRQDEEPVIIGISSIVGGTTTYTLDRPFAYDHVGIFGMRAYVAVQNRTVTFTSESTDLTRFGHTMFMHNRDVRIEYAAFVDLGRTDKSRPLDAINYDGTTNVRGRYGLHLHRSGIVQGAEPIQVVGNFLSGSPGWGYVSHSSQAVFQDNVGYDVLGAVFVTETGGEVGGFIHNLAVYAPGRTQSYGKLSGQLQDWGFRGAGFFHQGANIDSINNVASGMAEAGFVYTGQIFSEPGIGTATVPTWNLRDPSIANGAESIRMLDAPMRTFFGNEAFASRLGWESYGQGVIVTAIGHNRIESSIFWRNGSGILGAYTRNLEIANTRILNVGMTKTAIEAHGHSRNWTLRNLDVQGWEIGFRPVINMGTVRIIGGNWRNNGVNWTAASGTTIVVSGTSPGQPKR